MKRAELYLKIWKNMTTVNSAIPLNWINLFMKTLTRRYHMKKRLVSAMMIVITICFFTGCVSQKQTTAPVCSIPSSPLVDTAFQTARNTLSNPECKYAFSAIFDALLDISEQAPAPQNKEFFIGFLEWVRDKGIISAIQAKTYYTRYFSRRFVSLVRDYQTCGVCPRIDQMLKDCWEELKQKERGLKICSDKETYAKAYNDLQKIELILEATCSACTEE
jgi:hypothetical protein